MLESNYISRCLHGTHAHAHTHMHMHTHTCSAGTFFTKRLIPGSPTQYCHTTSWTISLQNSLLGPPVSTCSLLLYKLNLQEVVVRHVCQCHINTHTFRSLVGSNRFFLADFRQSIRQHLLPPNEDMSSWECVPVLITSCHYHSMLLLKSSQYLPETGWFPVIKVAVSLWHKADTNGGQPSKCCSQDFLVGWALGVGVGRGWGASLASLMYVLRARTRENTSGSCDTKGRSGQIFLLIIGFSLSL